MGLGLVLARQAARLPRGYGRVVKQIARFFPELHCTPVLTRFGQTIYCDLRESVAQQIFKNGGYARTVLEEKWYRENLSCDDVVLDVGANIGYMLVQFAPLVKHVHVFEPAPRALRTLRKTAQLYENVTLHDVAVSDQPGTVFFEQTTGLDRSHISSTGLPVQAITLDSLGIIPTLIKIDVEGHEQAVLRGASEILRQGPTVCFEALTDADRDETEAILKASNCHYQVEAIDFRNFVARVAPSQPALPRRIG
jgi:FkbM family methyltransferase